MTLLGGTNVTSAPEARKVLEQRGVADYITFPACSLLLFDIDKIVKYDMDMPFFTTTFIVVMNKAKYDGMSAAQGGGDRQPLHNRVGGEGRRSPWADWEICRP